LGTILNIVLAFICHRYQICAQFGHYHGDKTQCPLWKKVSQTLTIMTLEDTTEVKQSK